MAPRIRHSMDSDNKEWTKRETRQLIALIKSQLPEGDQFAYSRRIKTLNWQQISIPFKTIVECKSRLEMMIKNIPRTRTLDEILSVVGDDEPAAIKKRRTSAEVLISKNNNSPMIKSFKRKSERLSSGREQQRLKELTLKRSLTPFMFFQKFNNSDNNKDLLKEQFSTLDDIDKLFWIRKTITSASEDDRIEDILTEEEIGLLEKELKLGNGKKATIICDNENKLPDQNIMKRKLEENNTISVLKKKIRKENRLDEEMHQPKQIQPKSVTQEIVVVSNHGCVDVEPLHISSSEIEMEKSYENDTSKMNAVHNGDEDVPLVEDLLRDIPNTVTIDTLDKTEELDKTEIETPIADVPELTNINLTTVNQTRVMRIKYIKCEDPDDFKNKAIKQEFQEPRRFYSRVKNFCGGLVGRIGNWLRD